MSEATEAAFQLGSPRQIAVRVPRHTEGHGPDEQRRVIEEDLMQCFVIMEQNWKIFFCQRTAEGLHGNTDQHPFTLSSVTPLKSFPHLPPREPSIMEGEWRIEEEEQDLSVSLAWVFSCRETFVASCELRYSAKRKRKWLKQM